jgi:hypothetical protein
VPRFVLPPGAGNVIAWAGTIIALLLVAVVFLRRYLPHYGHFHPWYRKP